MSIAHQPISDFRTKPLPVEKPPAAVSLVNVGLIYSGGVEALHGISLQIEKGKHVAVLGASGSGKTSLLGCLAGRLLPTSGRVDCDGPIATIHQDLRLVKQRSALQNVLHGTMGRQPLWRTLGRFPAPERDKASKLLARVGLSNRLHTPVARLSGGEQQRVAIARALMQDPAILLADEPVASLDSANAQSIMRLLSDLQREHGLTLISVLHDCELAETFADRILGFQSGKLVHDDCGCHLALELKQIKTGPRDSTRGFKRFDPCGACELIQMLPSGAPSAAPAIAPPPRRPWRHFAIAAAVLALYAWAVAGVGITGRETDGVFGNLLRFAGRLLPDSWAQLVGIQWLALGKSLVDTMRMALLGTTVAVLISWPLAALAARNVGPGWLCPITRFCLNAIRAVPSLIWALLLVAAVGLGELAGLIALVFYSIGYLTKFFYEAFEAVDPGPPSALDEIGASGPQKFLHAVWPAARAAVLSSSLFMIEYNVRAASVLGVVGAGGIGYDLKLHVDYGNFHVVGAILLMLVAVVILLDAVSGRIRSRLMRP